ncbi:RNA-directed RNA polymerase [ssRNA phage Zoerhiza.3_6]|uniref:RNA-directed RNA polymerase n=2 Tax=Leviviricetes TaxID=2842243 RepID=A0A8S5KXV7_9VIRU|nr:RNA-directed RNA polymerase [ssRNA phage Zoerhiza.3_6]QDH86617.1 MAG: RNA-dependent RNA polymerase [Leviviridae sp.]DAD49935.1 TPA_asm: RNA-directed RNA polymerase [ssRNA phage Zoerhiza.3_6]
MKRHVKELSRVCEHLLRDAAYTFPSLREEFERDLARITRLVKQRGIHLFTVDLVAAGKHLDRCLDAGEYNRSGLPCCKGVSHRIVIPKLLRGLYLLVFDEDGCLKDAPSIEAIFFLRQILCFAKKTSIDCSQEAKDREVQDFVTTDDGLPEPSRFWEDPSCTPPDEGGFTAHFMEDTDGTLSAFLGTLDKVSDVLTSTLGPYRVHEWRFKHGPGSVSNAAPDSNKYCWQNWSSRLETAFPIADCGFHSYASWADFASKGGIGEINPSSKLICVPKTIARPRLIAAEPTEHQWCQQNCWDYMGSRSADSWISGFVRFRDQTHNQDLCLSGSGTGSLVTLDLSCASDRVSCRAVECLFRCNPHLLKSLAACRTHSVVLPNGKVHKLRKYATMGNATTFPVQSLMFLSVCLSAVLHTRRMAPTVGNIKSLMGEVAVFGDDLIVPKDSRELVIRGLELLKFKVNLNKSFWNGKFRESCGVDAFAGIPVTPVYWKGLMTGKPESVAMTVAVHNNLVSKFLMHTAGYIASTLHGLGLIHVAADSGVFGLSTRTLPPLASYCRRYNKDMCAYEVRALTIRGRSLRTKVEDDTAVLQYFTEAPSPFTFWESGIPQRATLRMKRGWVREDDAFCSKCNNPS